MARPSSSYDTAPSLSPVGHGLLWPAIALGVLAWVVELAGLAAMQAVCSPAYFGASADAKLTAGFPLALGCGNQMRFLWFILWLVRYKERGRRGGAERGRARARLFLPTYHFSLCISLSYLPRPSSPSSSWPSSPPPATAAPAAGCPWSA